MTNFLRFLENNGFRVTYQSPSVHRYFELTNDSLKVILNRNELFCDSVSAYNKTGDCPFYRKDISLIREEHFQKLLKSMMFWTTNLGIQYSKTCNVDFWDRDDFRN